jgi:general secretion pathway protein J
MKLSRRAQATGFTLIELLTALLILSVLALMSYRGLGALLDARTQVTAETEKWHRVAAFFGRFERDVQLAAPRPVRNSSGELPAWLGRAEPSPDPSMDTLLEFSRFGSIDGSDVPRRVGYRLNERQEIELWLWPALDNAPATIPARYVVLAGVTALDIQYLNTDSVWVSAWPGSRLDPAVPRAVRLHVVLASKEDLVRIFALKL